MLEHRREITAFVLQYPFNGKINNFLIGNTVNCSNHSAVQEFEPLSRHQTLKDILRGGVVIEFPTIIVCLNQ